MSILLHKIEHVLQGMATPLAIHLPSGQRIGPVHPAVTLGFHDLGALTALGKGQVGALAEGLVEGRIWPDGHIHTLQSGALPRELPGAQSVYPFRRDYIYSTTTKEQ